MDVVREGFDCVLRVGPVADSGLVARPLGQMQMVNCASPGYLRAHGVPVSLTDLAQHQLVHYATTLGAPAGGFEYVDGAQDRSVLMAGAVTVSRAEAHTAACLAGLCLIQVPLLGVQGLLAQGRLVQVLDAWPAHPMPPTLLYAHRRNLSRRVRVVMDWLAGVLADHLAQQETPAG
jgi:DNA-binding transcriptional LysR family regulator